jgi:hypothetical protein
MQQCFARVEWAGFALLEGAWISVILCMAGQPASEVELVATWRFPILAIGNSYCPQAPVQPIIETSTMLWSPAWTV